MSKRLDGCIQFGFLVHDVSRLRRVVADRQLKAVGITWSQWSVLVFLSRRGGVSQTAIATELDLTKVAIGGLLDRMEAAGLVERRADKDDARSRRVFLSRAGRKVLGQVDKQVEHFAPYLMRRVTDADLAATIRSLELVKENLLLMIAEG
jgi:DNA-binding MarR family transcriptional regulator